PAAHVRAPAVGLADGVGQAEGIQVSLAFGVGLVGFGFFFTVADTHAHSHADPDAHTHPHADPDGHADAHPDGHAHHVTGCGTPACAIRASCDPGCSPSPATSATASCVRRR